MSTLNISLLSRRLKKKTPGARINPQWLELPIPRTNFHDPEEVRII